LTDEVKKQNQELQMKYGVRGFPTLFLLDAEGNVLGQTGYQPGGPDAYISNLKALLAKGDAKKEAETK
jgi:protein disulfide-isomerase